ncbi:hypothetical protein ACLBYG_25215 [Methylobacterium sp. D53M]
MSDSFNAGPRLADPQGDATRQAVDALRGYAFQLYASVLAWLVLGAGEDLHLEVAEDYASVTRDAMNAVQAKDTGGSGTATLRTDGVRQAIETFVDLTRRNPGRQVHLRYLTTSKIGIERAGSDRIAGGAALHYWERVAQGRAEVAPLRARLLASDLDSSVADFLSGRSDDAMRDEFVRRIVWDCGRGGVQDLRAEIEAVLATDGRHGPALDIDELPRAASSLVEAVLEKAIAPLPRKLTVADRARVLRRVTHTSLPTADLRRLLSTVARAGAAPNTPEAAEAPNWDWVYPVSAIGDPHPVVVRRGLVDDVAAAASHGAAVVVGGTGFGKSLLARQAARATGGDWLVADLRDLPANVVRERLSLLLARSGQSSGGGLILDDFDEWDDAGVARGLALLLSAVARRGAALVATTHREPTARVLASLGIASSAPIAATPMTSDEVAALIAMAGGDGDRWGKVVHLGSGGGHPQLAQAAVLGLAARGWPEDALVEHLVGRNPDVLREREAVRARLREAVPPEARSILYRSSLVLGRLPRRVALALGCVLPAVDRPGEALDRLVGPWIDAVGPEEYRVSPLVGDAGRAMLSRDEQTAVHRAVVDALLAEEGLATDVADAVFFHALEGERPESLAGLCTSIISADDRVRRVIAAQSVMLRHLRTDRLAYPKAPVISKLLRLAQVVLLLAKGDDETTLEGIEALLREINQGVTVAAVDRAFEGMALCKLLLERRLGTLLRDRWVDLFLRFDEVASGRPEWQEAERSFADAHQSRLGLRSLIIAAQCSALTTVADLEALFERLGSVAPDRRDGILSGIAALPGGNALMVSRSWLAEAEAGAIDWPDAASRYLGMAQRAADWGARDLALRCHAARAVMLDEYGREPDAALRALDEAAGMVGPDPVLARARAKVLWRRREHAAALPLLEEAVAASSSQAPVERAFLLREAAISAAELGDWAKAAAWFAQGRDAAYKVGGVMTPMAIGLEADIATAAWHLARADAAVRGMAECLRRLAGVDPQGEVKNAYVHRIVRHAILWMHDATIARRTRLDDGGELAMPPGAGSNPEPDEAVRDLPLAEIDVAWYLLAQVDLATGGGGGVAATLHAHLAGGPVPGQEIRIRQMRVAMAIRSSDPAAFAEALVDWVAASLYLYANEEALLADDVLAPARGPMPDPTPSELSRPPAVNAAVRAAVAFGIAAVLAGRTLPADTLAAGISARLGPSHPAVALVARMAAGSPPMEKVRDGADAVALLRSRGGNDPSDLFVVTLRLVEEVGRSDFRNAIESPLWAWIGQRWTHAATQQRFALRDPRTNGPAILSAIETGTANLASAVRVTLAALPAVRVRLHHAVMEDLRRMIA